MHKEPHPSDSSTTEGLPVAPGLGPALDANAVASYSTLVDGRVVRISGVAAVLGIAAGFIAQALVQLIGLITNLSFYGRLSTQFVSPAQNQLGIAVIAVPVAGALLVGLMARYGSAAIRGHGIPEAMEQVLFNQSKIPPRITFLKPLSAAISIGTGGPFGAEGPIIATGGALGSVVGQLLTITADERKTLLAAGAAAGMAATFGSPVSAVLLAIELLLFEYRPRSVIPVALASVAATAVRMALSGAAPVFAVAALSEASGSALGAYALIGALIGAVAVYVTRAVYAIEDAFELLPVHWMWWPAIGAVVVGVVGFIAPRTLGVGYDNIEQIASGGFAVRAVVILTLLKFVSWAIALGSGTSGGTLAPLFTIGAGAGFLLGDLLSTVAPGVGVDPRMAAVVGMAAMFAGASRAFLASVVFAFETTRQMPALLPLLGGCAPAYLVSCLLMPNSIMTEKIARRGARVPSEYGVDFLDQVMVRDCASRAVVTLRAQQTLQSVRDGIHHHEPNMSHQGFPVVAADGSLLGVVTRRDLLDPQHGGDETVRDVLRRTACVAYEDNSLREVADLMVRENIGRVPIVARMTPHLVTGIVTRSDLLLAHQLRLEAAHRRMRTLGPRLPVPA